MAPIASCPSPNFDSRRCPVSLLILHYTNMPSAEQALARLCDPASKVSAHYLIDRQGQITQMVDEGARAWHAGVAHWAGLDDVNSASIGIELDHVGHVDGHMAAYPPLQMAALVDLSRDIISRHPIAPAGVLGHSDVAPMRKIDPGEALDWRQLAAQGVGLWADNVPVENVDTLTLNTKGPAVAALQKTLAAYGYGVVQDGVYGPHTQAIVRAFQRHFRAQKIDGAADGQTQSLIYALCRLAVS